MIICVMVILIPNCPLLIKAILLQIIHSKFKITSLPHHKVPIDIKKPFLFCIIQSKLSFLAILIHHEFTIELEEKNVLCLL